MAITPEVDATARRVGSLVRLKRQIDEDVCSAEFFQRLTSPLTGLCPLQWYRPVFSKWMSRERRTLLTASVIGASSLLLSGNSDTIVVFNFPSLSVSSSLSSCICDTIYTCQLEGLAVQGTILFATPDFPAPPPPAATTVSLSSQSRA